MLIRMKFINNLFKKSEKLFFTFLFFSFKFPIFFEHLSHINLSLKLYKFSVFPQNIQLGSNFFKTIEDPST